MEHLASLEEIQRLLIDLKLDLCDLNPNKNPLEGFRTLNGGD